MFSMLSCHRDKKPPSVLIIAVYWACDFSDIIIIHGNYCELSWIFDESHVFILIDCHAEA